MDYRPPQLLSEEVLDSLLKQASLILLADNKIMQSEHIMTRYIDKSRLAQLIAECLIYLYVTYSVSLFKWSGSPQT